MATAWFSRAALKTQRPELTACSKTPPNVDAGPEAPTLEKYCAAWTEQRAGNTEENTMAVAANKAQCSTEARCNHSRQRTTRVGAQGPQVEPGAPIADTDRVSAQGFQGAASRKS